MDPMTMYLLSSIIGGGFSFLGGMNQPQNFQPQLPFTGANDPETLLGDSRAKTDVTWDKLFNNHPSLPDAVVSGDTPTFSGGGLPMPIGMSVKVPDALRRAPSIPGITDDTFGGHLPPGVFAPGPNSPHRQPGSNLSVAQPGVTRRGNAGAGNGSSNDPEMALAALRALGAGRRV